MVVGSSSFGPVLLAQGPVPDAPLVSAEAASPIALAPVALTPASEPARHRFWDVENLAIFSATAATNAADFAVTRSNLQSGGKELNPMVRIFGRSTAGLAMNFAGETAGVVSLSYLFHRTGHHKLERILPIVNIGCTAGAVTFGLTHP